jgi:nucleoside 2-deoxyribosyltransferase
MNQKTITICSSAAFYKHVIEVKKQLEEAGFAVLVPKTALKMEESGSYDVDSHKTWFDNADDYHIKAELMRAHFDKVAQGDAILVVNDKKHGVDNYVGGNVLMEMAIAFHLQKPIYLFNGIPKESPFLEEVIGLGSIPLDGDLDKITEELTKLAV